MVVKRLSLSLALLLALALPLSADIITKKFEWTPAQGVQKLDFEWNEIAISEIRFDLGDTVAPIRYSSTKAVVRVDNNSRKDQEVGVAQTCGGEDLRAAHAVVPALSGLTPERVEALFA